MIRALLALVALYGLIVAGAWWFQDGLIYAPDVRPPSRETAGLTDMASVRVVTSDGLSLIAWYKKARPRQPTILYLHGNAGSIAGLGERVRPFLDQGLGVMLLEYRGYGGNAGQPSEEGLILDALAGRRYLVEEGVNPLDIVPYGLSLGAAVAVGLASRERVGAVVLEAPFTSLSELGAHHYWYLPVAALIRDRYDTLSRLPAVDAPVLVLHGALDGVVPQEMGRRVYERARAPKTLHLAPEAGHDDLPRHGSVPETLLFLRRFIVRT